MNQVDISLFPAFKEHVTGLIRELEAVYESDQWSEAGKADQFHRIMLKYDMV